MNQEFETANIVRTPVTVPVLEPAIHRFREILSRRRSAYLSEPKRLGAETIEHCLIRNHRTSLEFRGGMGR